MDRTVFTGVIPALMTPCTPDRSPDFEALVRKARQLMETGMSAVVYCGSMGDWPLLTDAQRMEGVARLVQAGIPSSSARARSTRASRSGTRPMRRRSARRG